MTTEKVWYVAVKKELPEKYKEFKYLIPGTRLTKYYSKAGLAKRWITSNVPNIQDDIYTVIEADLINHKEIV